MAILANINGWQYIGVMANVISISLKAIHSYVTAGWLAGYYNGCSGYGYLVWLWL